MTGPVFIRRNEHAIPLVGVACNQGQRLFEPVAADQNRRAASSLWTRQQHGIFCREMLPSIGDWRILAKQARGNLQFILQHSMAGGYIIERDPELAVFRFM